jgi:Ca-activated chloride channel family protein
MTLKLSLVPLRQAIANTDKASVDILVRVAGPDQALEGARRQTLNLALVLDRSGSMSGQAFHEAQQCAVEVVRKLGPDDYVSVVAYDDEVELVWRASRVTDPEAIVRKILAIQVGGSTALYDGWLAGAEQASINQRKADVSRVLLLSDGGANFGLTDPFEISQACGRMADVGVSTSTYGLGHHFNEQLMSAMAEAGRGNAYYGATAADLKDPFEAEFDLLRALAGRSVQVMLSSPHGAVDVLNTYAKVDGYWQLPDVPFGGEAWLLARLTLTGRRQVGERVGVGASLRYLIEGERQGTEGVDLRLQVVAPEDLGHFPEDSTVARRSVEVGFARLQERARDAARDRDWESVERLISQARELAAGHDWLAASLASLEGYARLRDEEAFAKEAHYRSRKLMARVAASAEDEGQWSIVAEQSQPSYLRRKQEEGKALRR